jgi:hypothetical protein
MAAVLKHYNFATSTIANVGGISDTDLSLDVQSGDGSLFDPDGDIDGSTAYIYVVLVDSSGNREIVKVTNIATDTLTIVRAQQGTSARAFSQDDKVELRATASSFLDIFLDENDMASDSDQAGVTQQSLVAYLSAIKAFHDSLTASVTEVNNSADGIGVTIPRQKVLEIGDWNMETTTYVYVAHGLTLSQIIGARALIRSDYGNYKYPFPNEYDDIQTDLELEITGINSTTVNLKRLTSGYFDGNSDFNATGYNRGWVIVDYLD